MKNYDMNKLRAAQEAITKLESGKSIKPKSAEHEALTWAVIELTNELLLDKRPLTKKEKDYGMKISKKFKAEKKKAKKENRDLTQEWIDGIQKTYGKDKVKVKIKENEDVEADPFLEGIMSKLDKNKKED